MQKKIRIVCLFMAMALLVMACKEEEEPSTTSSVEQTIIGNWSGVNDQGLPCRLKVESRIDSMIITSYSLTYSIGGDTFNLYKNNPDDAYILADTFHFTLLHDYQNMGTLRGRFWSTNYLAGGMKISHLKSYYNFNFSASNIGYSVTIHSSPQYSMIFSNDSVSAYYTYVEGFYAGHDTLVRQGKVILSSGIGYDAGISYPAETLLEIRMGSLPGMFTADQLRQLVSTGYKQFSINATDGVEVIYRDKSDGYKTWSTSLGPASQESSLFNISEIYPLSGSDTTYHLYKFIANFNCKLYDAEGNIKEVTNAMYLGLIGAGFVE